MDVDGECIPYAGRLNSAGYGRHREAYEVAYGPVPDGLEIDHLCRNKSCVNPRHLEAVTRSENQRRVREIMGPSGPAKVNAERTHCIHGHEFTPENTYYATNRTHRLMRLCRECHRRRMREQMRRKRAERRLAAAAG